MAVHVSGQYCFVMYAKHCRPRGTRHVSDKSDNNELESEKTHNYTHNCQNSTANTNIKEIGLRPNAVSEH